MWKPYGWLLLAGLLAFLGFVALVEMTYQLSDTGGGTMSLFGMTFEVKSAPPWIVGTLVLGVGGVLYRLAWNRFRGEWDDIQRILQGGAT